MPSISANLYDMRIGLYFKQAWYNLRVNKVYSAVFIAGTAVSVALVMAFLTVLSSRVVNTAPETHRDRMLEINNLLQEGDGGTLGLGVSPEFGEKFLDSLPGVECWTAVIPNRMGGPLTFRDAQNKSCRAYASFVDRNFWKVFDFQFLAGRPLSESGMHGKAVDLVVSEAIARRLTGKVDAVGKEVFWNGRQFRICGVVRDVPMSAASAFAEAWIPIDEYGSDLNSVYGRLFSGRSVFVGTGQVVILADDRSSFRKIRAEIEDRLEIFNNTEDSGFDLSLPQGIPSYVEDVFTQYGMHGDKRPASSFVWVGVAVLLLILLVPLFNLSGMVSSRMESRLTEFGTRKAFGARGGSIMSQITWENLLLTLIGGVLGLALSWILIEVFARQLSLMIPNGGLVGVTAYYGTPDAGYFDFRDFYNIYLGIALLLIIVVLNLLSALIPARRVIRHPITESLNYKK